MVDQLAYSPAQAAKVLGLSRGTIYRLIAAGRLKAKKCDGRTLLLRCDIEEFLLALPNMELEGSKCQ